MTHIEDQLDSFKWVQFITKLADAAYEQAANHDYHTQSGVHRQKHAVEANVWRKRARNLRRMLSSEKEKTSR